MTSYGHSWRIIEGDARSVLQTLELESIQTCVTSPPYELAYLAGIVDGEDSISVRRSTYAMRHGNGNGASFWERIKVKMVDPEAIDLLHETFGGSRRIENRNKGRDLYAWEATGRVANRALVALLPYLRVKWPQAQNCIQLRRVIEDSKKERVRPGRGHQGSAPRSESATALMEWHHTYSHRLNRVGGGDAECGE